jgi:hypothetical protein
MPVAMTTMIAPVQKPMPVIALSARPPARIVTEILVST